MKFTVTTSENFQLEQNRIDNIRNSELPNCGLHVTPVQPEGNTNPPINDLYKRRYDFF